MLTRKTRSSAGDQKTRPDSLLGHGDRLFASPGRQSLPDRTVNLVLEEPHRAGGNQRVHPERVPAPRGTPPIRRIPHVHATTHPHPHAVGHRVIRRIVVVEKSVAILAIGPRKAAPITYIPGRGRL